MMNNKFKREAAAPISLFFIVFVSRLLVGFTVSSAVLGTEYSTDAAISTAVAAVGALSLSCAVVKMLESGKNVLDNLVLRRFYGAFYVLSGALSISNFALFSSAELHREANTLLLAAFMIVACTYAASLGFEAISRFCALVFALTIIGVFGIAAASANKFESVNLFPIVQNGNAAMLKNAAYSLCSTNEIPLLFALRSRINGKIGKPFCFAIGLSFLLSLLIAVTVCGVLGNMASVSSYPVFELSQLARLGTGERVEAVFTALWIFAVFLKISVFLYCAALCFGKKQNRKNCAACGLAMFGITAVILYTHLNSRANGLFVYAPFLLFTAFLPAVYSLIHKRGNRIEKR